MFASNTGIAMSSSFLSNLCVKCNQKNCWPTLGLILNAVLFLTLLFLIIRTYNSEGFCDTGPMNEDGTPDWSLEISLINDEISYEWLDALSEVDYQRIKPFLQK